MNKPMILMVAPNGARKKYADHSALPITPSELADTAESCLHAGASMMHLHVRDESRDFVHCLDAKRYDAAFTAIRARVGDKLFLQATTEAVGLYNADEQMAMVRELADLQMGKGIWGVSLAVKELMHDCLSDETIADFFAFLQSRDILPQLILYDTDDRARFQALLRDGVLPARAYPCLFVLGRYAENQQSEACELLPFFSDLTGISHFMGCAFGAREASVAKACGLFGGHMRIGYENNTLLANGEISKNNAELIEQTARQFDTLHRRLPRRDEVIVMMRPTV